MEGSCNVCRSPTDFSEAVPTYKACEPGLWTLPVTHQVWDTKPAWKLSIFMQLCLQIAILGQAQQRREILHAQTKSSNI